MRRRFRERRWWCKRLGMEDAHSVVLVHAHTLESLDSSAVFYFLCSTKPLIIIILFLTKSLFGVIFSLTIYKQSFILYYICQKVYRIINVSEI
jgi:hypothetical protein